METIFYQLTYWIVLGTIFVIMLLIAIKQRLQWWPSFLIRLMFVSLMLIGFFLREDTGISPSYQNIPKREILLLDGSESIEVDTRKFNLKNSIQWVNLQQNRIVLKYGEKSEPLIIGKDDNNLINGQTSNLAEGLQKAAMLLGSKQGNIILVSDGQMSSLVETERALQEIEHLKHKINVVFIPPKHLMNDIQLRSLQVPNYLWEDGEFTASLDLYMPNAKRVALELEVNNKKVDSRMEELPAGNQVYHFNVKAPQVGINTFTARVIDKNDPNPNNNQAFDSAQIFPPPRAMLVTENTYQVKDFIQALQNANIEVAVLTPDQLPVNLHEMGSYQVVILNNLLAIQLTDEQVFSLRTYVSTLGRGLIFLGGNYAYTIGGYSDTLLEPIIPVKMEPPKRNQREPVYMALVIDGSKSMTYHQGDTVPLDLAKEAAIRIIESLNPEDTLGIVTYSGEPYWNLSLSPLGDGLKFRKAIDAASSISSGGGTMMYLALTNVIETMGPPQDDIPRNIILLSDGKSNDGDSDSFRQLARKALTWNIHINTIAFGKSADKGTMIPIAEESQGYYYYVPDATELPKVMIQASRSVNSEHIQEGETSLVTFQQNHPILAGLNLKTFPTMTAYNALVSREEEGSMDVLLSASFQDPILASWQFGLGRVIAWMGDAGQDWNADWQKWGEQGKFWSQVVRYSLPDPSDTPDPVKIVVDDTGIQVTALLEDFRNQFQGDHEVQFNYLDKSNNVVKNDLNMVSPGLYQCRFIRPGMGAYRGNLIYRNQDEGIAIEIPVHFTVNYPKELKPQNIQLAKQRLLEWATQTGGSMTNWDALLEQQQTVSIPDKQEETNEFEWFFPLLIVFWLIEIGLRRRWLPWS